MHTTYRIGKTLRGLVPPEALSFRPFHVYEIALADITPRTCLMQNRHSQSTAAQGLTIEWVSSLTDLCLLKPLVAANNLAALDFGAIRAAVAWAGAEPVACAWIATGSFNESELGLRFDLESTDAWLFAAVVAAKHRRQGIYGRLLSFIVTQLRQENMRRLLLGVSIGNVPSNRAHMQQGAKKVGSVFAIRSFLFRGCWSCGKVQIRSSRVEWGRSIRLAII